MAQEISDQTDGDVSVYATFLLAEIRVTQRRYLDALNLYRDVEKRLPNPMVSAEEVMRSVQKAMVGLTQGAKISQ